MQPRRRHPSDLSDARWELIRPTLEARRAARAGIRRPTHDLRELLDAILYVDRTGIPWRYLPHDVPPWQSVYGYFAKREADGVFDRLTGLLRRLARDYETLPRRSAAMIHLVMIDLMSRRLTGEATPNWRGT